MLAVVFLMVQVLDRQDDWGEILNRLRGGAGYDVPTTPEYPYFQYVKKLGAAAYPRLISFIDNEDPAIGRTAVIALMTLTGRETKLPNESNKALIKAQWETWLKIEELPSRDLLLMMVCEETEEDVRRLIDLLSEDNPEERETARLKLRRCALRHAALLRGSVENALDPEARSRLQEIVAGLPEWEIQARNVERTPELITRFFAGRNPKEQDPLRQRLEELQKQLESKRNARAASTP
jgi:hypothetical protein